MLDTWLQDVRYGSRLLRRNPLFALTAVASLAIGIGATTAIFSIANALLFKPPAEVLEPGRLVDVGRMQNGEGFDNGSFPNYVDLRARNTVFTDVYAYKIGAEPMSLGGADGAERIFGDMVSVNYFTVLGARAHLGRLFTPADSDQAGAAPFAVLSHHFWRRRFNGDPAIVGQTLQVNGRPFTVVGVAREGFHGTSVLTTDLWVPITMVNELSPRRSSSILASRESSFVVMGARLKPGVTLRQAQAEATNIGQALQQEFPEANRGKNFRVVATSPIPGNGAPFAVFFSILMGIVGLVLAIACANIAGVLLARATARRREIAVRLAIGASRWRLIRQMLVESMLLFLAGGAAGLALARAMTTAVVSLLPTLPVPLDVSLPLDARTVAFALAVTFVAAIVSGLAPALDASKPQVVGGLKADAQGGADRLWLRNAFVIGQVTFSIVLVVGAGLLGRALQHAADIDPGFDTHGVELAGLDLSIAGYTSETGPVFTRELIQRVRDVPGVSAAALAAMVPLGGGGLGLGGLTAPGVQPPQGQKYLDADWNVVTPGYFSTMKMSLVSGRDFTDADHAASPWVVIVNETAARRWWPNQEPIGKTLQEHTGRPGGADEVRTMTVIAVARDTKYRDLSESPRTFIYVPEQQQHVPRLTIVARSTHGQRLAAELRTALARLNPNLPIAQAQTMDDYAAVTLIPHRIAASVSGSLGFVGLLLAAIGIYGVTAYTVTSRTREIGIRVALGAQQGRVVRLVLRQGLTLTMAGAVLGLALAAGASRLLGSLLFGISATDPIAFVGSALLFCGIGLAACYVPARRALRINATEALRYE